MKAASGELNLTVITIVAIAAIMGIFTVFLYPRVKNSITNQWQSISDDSDKVIEDSRQS